MRLWRQRHVRTFGLRVLANKEGHWKESGEPGGNALIAFQ